MSLTSCCAVDLDLVAQRDVEVDYNWVVSMGVGEYAHMHPGAYVRTLCVVHYSQFDQSWDRWVG